MSSPVFSCRAGIEQMRKHPTLDAYSLARSRRGKKKRARTSLKLRRGRLAVLTYLLGPFLPLLPRRWRNLLPLGSPVEWRWATVLSGLGEALIALIAARYWYSYSMST